MEELESLVGAFCGNGGKYLGHCCEYFQNEIPSVHALQVRLCCVVLI
jgi:hypothetical protein